MVDDYFGFRKLFSVRIFFVICCTTDLCVILCFTRDRDSERRDRDNRDSKGSSRSNRDRELDEDDSYERRKRERRQKERSQAFVEVAHFELPILEAFICFRRWRRVMIQRNLGPFVCRISL